MPVSRDTMYWGLFLLLPDGSDKLESWHTTSASAKLREARLLVEHPLGWAMESEVRMILRSELPQFVGDSPQVAAA